MRITSHTVRLLFLILLAGLLMSACGSGGEEPTATISAEQIQTEAVATFAAFQTATAQAMPSATPSPTASPSPTITVTLAATNTAAPTAAQTGANSCYSLQFVSDVTVPDNTKVAPGAKITKTWRVRNNGTCAWDTDFKLAFTGGEAMGGTTVNVGSTVQAGSQKDLTVELTAPTTAGTYRGNWRMRTGAGAYFGDEIYVQIVVGDVTVTATKSVTATQSASATATVPAATNTPTATEEPSATSEP